MRKLISRVLPLVLVLVLAVGCLSAMAAETPALPSATITEVQNDDLTFAMNFRADIVTDEQLAYYGNWYADFVLTFSEPVTLNANGGADGYLSGQYDKWSENWVNVPFKDVTLQAGESLKIMEYASELMGKPGLKYTYKEVYESVQDFDCGVFLENDYILNNPDTVITLELRIFNNENENESYRVGDLYEFRFNFVARNTATGKIYEDVSDALRAAQDGQTVELLKDAADDMVSVFENTTLDLAGHTLTATYVSSFGDTVDSSADNSGVLAAKHLMIQPDNEQVTAKTAKGYQFFEVLSFSSAYIAAKEQFAFMPEFEAAARELLAPGVATTGVTVQVDVSWQTADGHTRTQLFQFSDEFVNGFLASYDPSTDWYGKMFTLTLKNTADFSDLTFEASVVSDTSVRVSENDFNEVESSGNVVTQDTTITHENGSALVPAGTVLDEGATALVLSATEMDESQSNVTLSDGETMLSMDVCVEGVSKENTTPIIVTLNEVTAEGLNIGNITLYHVENGVTTEMTRVFSIEEVDEHNEYYYDIETGTITMALASFSEISFVTENTAPWEGDFDYSWYKADATELTIANADQLAAFSAIVGGMDGQAQDSFSGKTVKLICDINLNDASSEDGKVFYPIGYYNTTGAYTKQSGITVSSYFQSFEGTFDGNGNTVANFYQNTWEMFGDYNEGYAALSNHYRDGMGLFGHVNGGTVKNLTVENFSSDGEHNTTGCIAAYADCGATFENISIFSCNPRVYNIGNGGIVGCVGWYAGSTVDTPVTFRNITVDNTNKISALWGSWDVACGGIVGQYYPTSGQSSANYPANAGIYMENCHVSAQIDVYNDVCANYQYYAYRYSGMLIGSVRENVNGDDGRVYPKMDGITASGCTVKYGDWANYYYCELEANTMASYSPDYQFSRLDWVKAVDGTTVTALNGEEFTVPAEGRCNYVVVNGDHGTANAECYHFVNGQVHTHTAEENNQHIYLPFDNQLVTGYGWGVTSKGIESFGDTKVEIGNYESSAPKFAATGTNEFEASKEYTIGEIFTAAQIDLPIGIKDRTVQVFVSPAVDENGNVLSNVSGTYTANTTDWTQGKLTFTGSGAATVTITDYYFCNPTTITVTVESNFVKGQMAQTIEDILQGGKFAVVAEVDGKYYAMVNSIDAELDAAEVSVENNVLKTYANYWTVEVPENSTDIIYLKSDNDNNKAYLICTTDTSLKDADAPFDWIVTDTTETTGKETFRIMPSNNDARYIGYSASVTNFRTYAKTHDAEFDLYFFLIEPACTHTYNEVVTAPTCTEGGYTTYTCTLCGYSYVGAETDPAGHTPNAEGVVTAPTCTEGGYTTYTCSVCKETYTADEVAATGHSYGEGVETTAPSCTETGVKTYTCTVCGTTKTETIAATGHSYESVVTEPTCTEAGYTTYTCSVCGDTYTGDEVKANGHTYVDGTCSVCGEKQPTWTLVTDANSLKVGDKIVIVATDYNYALSTTQKTNNRGQAAVTKSGDSVEFGADVQIITLKEGTKDGTFAFYVEGDSTGYLYAASSSSNNLKTQETNNENGIWSISIAGNAATITANGSNSRKLLSYNQTSSLFSCYATNNKQKDISIYVQAIACDHSWGEGVETSAPSCTETGVKTYTCSSCGTTKTEVIAALGHTEVVDAAVAATCTATGLTEGKHCSVCNATLVAQTETEMIDHDYVDGTCSVCGKKVTTIYTVSFNIEGIESEEAEENDIIGLPTDVDAPEGYTFYGWAETNFSDTTSTANIYTDEYTVTKDVTLYAVYSHAKFSADGEYKKTDIAAIGAADRVVITMTYTDGKVYALSSANGTSSAPTAAIVTVNSDKLSAEPDKALIWNIGGDSAGYIIYPNGTTDTWLYSTSSNDGVRVGNNSNKTWTIDSVSGYLKHTGTSRYLGVYRTNPDWRAYTNTTGNTANQTLGFYVKTAEVFYTTNPVVCEHTNKTTTSTATCTEAGVETVTCDDCQKVISTTNVNALGHNYVDGTCSVCGATESTGEGITTATLDFTSTAHRTSCSTSQQVWNNNGLTLTNNKTSGSSNVVDDVNPAKLYAKSEVKIDFTSKISTMTITCSSSTYATAMANSLNQVDGANATTSGSVVTVTFSTPVTSITFTMTAQSRVKSLVVNPQ